MTLGFGVEAIGERRPIRIVFSFYQTTFEEKVNFPSHKFNRRPCSIRTDNWDGKVNRSTSVQTP